MSRVAIIGAGDLGGAITQALAARDRVTAVLLVDPAVKIAEGKALDIRQSGAVDGFHCRIDATDDLSSVTGAAVCILADRVGPPAAEWHGEQALAMLGRLLTYSSGAPLIFAGASHAELIRQVATELRTGTRDLLIGTATEAYASAVRAIVALEAGCSPSDVMLSVLGTPGALVVPWSEASVGGYALERVLSPTQITRVELRAARLWPPGPYTLGVAAARAAEAVVTSSRATISALTLLGGEFGVRNRIGALPVQLSKHGIARIRVPSLNTRERVLLDIALGAP
jgi:malate dehydrogenase